MRGHTPSEEYNGIPEDFFEENTSGSLNLIEAAIWMDLQPEALVELIENGEIATECEEEPPVGPVRIAEEEIIRYISEKLL